MAVTYKIGILFRMIVTMADTQHRSVDVLVILLNSFQILRHAKNGSNKSLAVDPSTCPSWSVELSSPLATNFVC